MASSDRRIRPMIAPERTFVRSRGCWNCVSYEGGQLSRQHWRTCRARDEAYIASTQPQERIGDQEKDNILKPPNLNDPRYQQLAAMETAVLNGSVGLCMKGPRPKDLGGPDGDFVACTFLCDRWTAKEGASVATAGQPIDPLNEELAEIALDRAKRGR